MTGNEDSKVIVPQLFGYGFELGDQGCVGRAGMGLDLGLTWACKLFRSDQMASKSTTLNVKSRIQ